MNNFQREGAPSNTSVGNKFEAKAERFFKKQGFQLTPKVSIAIGINRVKRQHKFDLVDIDNKVLIECKSHTWTKSGKIPSAKMTTWDQAMYFFHAAPNDYRKILFVLRDLNKQKGETLAEYYIRTKQHLIPKEVEIWEFDESIGKGGRIK